jgi:hypothetical protein
MASDKPCCLVSIVNCNDMAVLGAEVGCRMPVNKGIYAIAGLSNMIRFK